VSLIVAPYNDKNHQRLAMSTLIITLPKVSAHAGTLFDYVLTPDGQQISEQSSAPLALLPKVGRATDVVAVVPVQQLSWHLVQLPKGILGRRLLSTNSPQRLRAVLDGLLEDHLLDDPAQLHFALEPQPQAEAPVWVAACDRAWLQGALQVLEQAGLPVSRIVPAFAPASLGDSLWVMGQPGDAQVVCTARGGVTVWPLSKATVALLDWPQGQPIVAEPGVAALAEQLFNRPVDLASSTQQSLQAAQLAWDLAQFDFVNSSHSRTWKHLSAGLGPFLKTPRWRAARLGLLALLLINLVGLNTWAWKEQAAINAKKVAIKEVLTRTFPSVRVVVDAPVQMNRELLALQQANGAASGRDLEALLSHLEAVTPAGYAPTAIDFAPGELRLKGPPFKPDELSAMAFKLKPRGYGLSAQGDSLLLKQVSAP
jgi:general secretion pathway protein L